MPKGPFRPTHGQVVVRPVKARVKALSGRVVLGVADGKPQLGKVVAVGTRSFEQGTRIGNVLNTGDRIVFGRSAGTEIVHDGQKFLIMRETDILGVVGAGGFVELRGGGLPGEPGTLVDPPDGDEPQRK